MDGYPKTKSEALKESAKTEPLVEPSSVLGLTGSNKQLARAEERVSLIALILLTVMGGTLISFYVLGIGSLTARKKSINRVSQAALVAADLINQITVEHPSFGCIGITDQEPVTEGIDPARPRYTKRVIGVNTLYATLRLDAILAHRLNLPVMLNLVHKDLQLAHRLENSLREKLYRAVEQDLTRHQAHIEAPEDYSESLTKQLSHSIYHKVHATLIASRSDRDTSLVEVRLKLGTLKFGRALSKASSQISSGSRHEGISDELVDGTFRAGVPLTVPDSDPISFIALGEKTSLIDPDDFVPTTGEQTPSAVLLEVVYENQSQKAGSSILTITQRACALLGGKPIFPSPSCFVINFPDGAPPQFKRPTDLFRFNHWSSDGEWQQVVGGEIPGKGSLAPTLQPILPSMPPSDAVSVAVYHWLRQLGPNVDPERFLKIFATPWETMLASSQEEARTEAAEHSPINSCLVRDTGAREYAIMNQTGQGGVGQVAIGRCFRITVNHGGHERIPCYPPSALPLVVDANGDANLPGCCGFDYKLVKDFFKASHQTNLAALESLSLASEIFLRSENNLSQIEQSMLIEQQELNSMRNRLSRLTRQDPKSGTQKENHKLNEVPTQTRSIERKILELKTLLEHDRKQHTVEKRVHELAELAKHNANKIATDSFELTSHSFKLCQEGLSRIDSSCPQFLIGKRLVFVPQTVPLQEADFEIVTGKSEFDLNVTGRHFPKAEPFRAVSPWLLRGLNILLDYRYASSNNAKSTTEGKALSEIEAMKPQLSAAVPAMIVLDSDSVLFGRLKNTPQPKMYRNYPFHNIRLPSGQLFYYCQNALTTGKVPQLSWSAVIRDLVAYKLEDRRRSLHFPGRGTYNTGEPIPASEHEWCRQDKEPLSTCPSIACEIQIRRPLPILTDSLSGAYLTNPDNAAQVPQIPPVPPDLF